MRRLVIVYAAAALLLVWSCGTGHNHNEHNHADGHEAVEADHGHAHNHAEEAHEHSADEHAHGTAAAHADAHGTEAAHADEHAHEATRAHAAAAHAAAAHADATHAHEAQAAHASDEIVLPAAKARAAGVATETAAPAPFSGVIRTGGQILPAPGDEITIISPIDGIVSFKGNYVEGSQVAKDKQLFSIVSGGIQDGDRIGQARIAYETAKTEYERASALAESKIVSQKELNRLKQEYESARLAYEALRPDADGKGAKVEVPMSGYIKSLQVKEGDFVSVGTPLATITQNRRLILKADLSQRYFDRLGRIVSANFKTPYDKETQSLTDFGGRLISSGRSTADGSYYIPVTFEFDNKGTVVPGSFAEVWLLTADRQNVISLPTEAITEEQGLYFVYIQLDEGCYRKQEVTLGESNGRRTEILTGVHEGDNVVVKGAYNVKLASASNAIPAHSHNH